MVYYVAHKYGGDPVNLERAKRIVHDLQTNDLSNAYICPLIAFSHLRYGEIGYKQEMALCLDILSVSDALIVTSPVSYGVQEEINFANMVGMEVLNLEDKYREV